MINSRAAPLSSQRVRGGRSACTVAIVEALSIGSVSAIDAEITHIAPPSALARAGYRLVPNFFYDDVRFVINAAMGATLIDPIFARLVGRRS